MINEKNVQLVGSAYVCITRCMVQKT